MYKHCGVTLFFCENAYAIVYNEPSADHVVRNSIGNYFNSKIYQNLSYKSLGYLKNSSISFNIFDSGKSRFEKWVQDESSNIDESKTYQGWV